MILRKIIFVILTLSLWFLACSQKTQVQEINWEGTVITGTVIYMDLEGGFYGIKGDDGNNYDPLNLSSEFQKDGIRIKAGISFEKNVSSIRMWGKIIRINQIILLE